MADLNKLAEDIVGLTLLQAQELKTILKDKYGIEPAAGGAVMMAAGPAAAAAPVANQTIETARHQRIKPPFAGTRCLSHGHGIPARGA